MSTTTRNAVRLSHEDKLKLVPELVTKLQSGTKFSQIRRDPSYPSSGLRKALAAAGYNTKGEPIEGVVKPLKGSSAKVLAKRVAEHRAAGDAWWRLELATGKTTRELRKLLADHGHEAS